MKAVQFANYGGPEVLEVKDVQKPKAGEGQVLVQIKAASINPFDITVLSGRIKEKMPLTLPITTCGDFAGIIAEVGENAGDFRIGDEVYGQAAVYGGGTGSFAQFAAAKVGKIAVKPKNTDFIEAASLPLVGISAVQAIDDEISLDSGQKILIHGGAGGIGSIALQIAKAKGAYVATTVGPRDREFAKSLGADLVIDYKTEDFTQKAGGFDAVFNTAKGDAVDKSFEVVRAGGIIVSMTGFGDPRLGEAKNIRTVAQNSEGTTERLNKLREYIESANVKPVVDKVFPLDEAREAFKYQMDGKPRGKVVVRIEE